MKEDSQVAAQLPEYSDELVGFVRALDSAEMAVRTGRWHFGDLDEYSPEMINDAEGVPVWARQNLDVFAGHLPALRSAFRAMVVAESGGIAIEGNALGDADTPDFVQAAFDPVLLNAIQHRCGAISTAATNLLSSAIREQVGEQKVVYWDNEVYVIPDSFPNSFVEVWFRRAYGYWEDGGAYPLRLEPREYGWQAFGIER